MSCLLLGAGGRLGRELQKTLAGRFSVTALSHAEADISDAATMTKVVARLRPEAIVNAAAWTDVTGAETHEAEAYRVNATGVGVLAKLAQRFDIPLLHYSTDYVFSGDGDLPWRETDPTAPLSVYGASKLAGEGAFLQSGARGVIVRVGWLHSGEKDFVSAILTRALTGASLSVVDNQWGTPTEVAALARWTVASLDALWSTDGVRVVHYAESGDYVSRFEMANYLLRRAEAAFTRSGDRAKARLSREAYLTMEPSRLNDGIRPCNCRLAPTVDARFAPFTPWQEGVDKSVEKMI